VLTSATVVVDARGDSGGVVLALEAVVLDVGDDVGGVVGVLKNANLSHSIAPSRILCSPAQRWCTHVIS
jgi:hypothetical protein